MVKKAKDEDVVNAFLSARNRPFSLQQIVDGLQSKGLKKTACERALNVLVENGNVTLKEFGKAKIFLCRQDSIEIPDEQEMLQMDSEITHKAHELKQLTEKRQVLEKQISALNTAISLSDAISKCDQLSEEIAESKRKLDAMGPESEQVTEEEKKRVEDQYKKMRKEWTSRKRTAKDILDGISEGGGKKPKELVEEIGLEMDEKQDSALAQLPAIDEPNKRNGIGKYRRADHGKD
uniref:Homologous-pairing protein 2 homolog n=2 Tax=Rhodosorus marinus TaxID=101924 RepID=A0A7S3A8Q2_9RHOD|mmetsp:Transcript_45673/g.177830  ORF Transcript_45673/g.177830 Transcript_45673/m.177830 type:complete len:235 (+) Transcript_45673:334-1038(+)